MEKKEKTPFHFFIYSIAMGVPAGIGISSVITLCISYAINDGSYYPVPPALAAACGSILKAVLVQTLVSALIGTVSVAAAAIWNTDSWNLTQQILIDFAVRFGAIAGGGWLCRWYPHTRTGFVSMTVIFAVIYIGIWVSQWLLHRRRIRQINEFVMTAQHQPYESAEKK